MNADDYEKILMLFQSGEYELAQQLARKNVNNFADWLADKIIYTVIECNLGFVIKFKDRPGLVDIELRTFSWRKISAYYHRYKYNNFNAKIGRINALLRLKQYDKVKQKLKGVLKTLLISAIHNKLN